jgi:1-acyl-sn-glycerol-3-phosphate acyltransferase
LWALEQKCLCFLFFYWLTLCSFGIYFGELFWVCGDELIVEDNGLLQVSNHVASVDDPFIIASLLPPSVLMDAQNLRWTLCASDRCFKNPVSSAFFQSVKVLPVARGEGIYQKVSF